MKIGLLDPSLTNNFGEVSSNLGDVIINEAIICELNDIFPSCSLIRVSSHVPLLLEQIRELNECSLIFVGGSNILCSNMHWNKTWGMTLINALLLKRAVLLGVGWWQYEGDATIYTKLLLRVILTRHYMHSVRDSYTGKKLKDLGYQNVINTGCPTMWPLVSINFEEIPKKKADNALLMLTDYNQNPEVDKQLGKLLLKTYDKVFFWPQGKNDKAYLMKLDLPLIMLDHSLKSLNEFLSSEISVDYIGTRLHGGIKCLIARKRSLILSIDNRAKEIARDSGLTVIERDNIQLINQWINSYTNVGIRININSIEEWKSQFQELIKCAQR
jgi:hypothetical protein